jgi:hypothetical protein
MGKKEQEARNREQGRFENQYTSLNSAGLQSGEKKNAACEIFIKPRS